MDVRTGVAVRGLSPGHVVCDDGSHPADLILIGAGAVPNVELAREAGLAMEDGMTVDAQCRTSDPAIYAIGDCTVQHHALFDRRLRLESVHNALEQGRIAAAAITGKPAPALQVPWFWSDQYDVKLQMVGLSPATTRPSCAAIPTKAAPSPCSISGKACCLQSTP